MDNLREVLDLLGGGTSSDPGDRGLLVLLAASLYERPVVATTMVRSVVPFEYKCSTLKSRIISPLAPYLDDGHYSKATI